MATEFAGDTETQDHGVGDETGPCASCLLGAQKGLSWAKVGLRVLSPEDVWEPRVSLDLSAPRPNSREGHSYLHQPKGQTWFHR